MGKKECLTSTQEIALFFPSYYSPWSNSPVAWHSNASGRIYINLYAGENEGPSVNKFH